ncbi:MAG TPA: TetR/AcrR family transcriptional regulator [Tepidisphaeraceae bacterium]|jgi:AcrR family transcriptional regulator
MQRPDEKKRALIAATAARLFATRPFHKVKLDDVAAEAGVGKGTLYIYFKSKEDLYFWLIYDAFTQVLERLKRQLEGEQIPAGEGLRRILSELVKFAFDHPTLYELMRTAGPIIPDERWADRRREFTGLIERTIRRGNVSGEFDDPHPQITALCVPGLVRSVMLFGPKGLDEATVTAQLIRLIERGVYRNGKKAMKRTRTPKRTALASGRGGR